MSVGILMGSKRDLDCVRAAFDVLDDFGVPFTARILSAHRTPEEAAEFAKQFPKAMVIGGGSIYRQMLPFCDKAIITKVHTTTGCDTWFPNLDERDDWYLAETLLEGEEDGIGYEMLLYKRK